MSRQLAIEWDVSEIRGIIAEGKGRRTRIHKAFAIPIGADGISAETLSEKLNGEQLGKRDATFILGRSDVEIRTLELPPAPDDELPELVRFQAQRQFSSLASDVALDYVRLADANDQVQVLAAITSPNQLADIDSVSKACQLSSRHVLLRPFAAAGLVAAHGAPKGACVLVDSGTIETDLTILKDGEVLLVRTIRAYGHTNEEQRADFLVKEIRRTILAAQSQLNGDSLQEILLTGTEVEHKATKAALTEGLEVNVRVVEPFKLTGSVLEMDCAVPERAGRYTALLGAVVCAAEQQKPAIDFLNPKKRVVEGGYNRQHLLTGVAGVLAICIVAYLIVGKMFALDAEIANLKEQKKTLDARLAKMTEKAADVKPLDDFRAGSVLWLDELARMCNQLPDSDAVYLEQMTLRETPQGGQLIFRGLADQAPTITLIEDQLRDEQHQVFGKGGTQNGKGGKYSWSFNETLNVPERPLESVSSESPEDLATEAEGDEQPEQAEKGSDSAQGEQSEGERNE